MCVFNPTKFQNNKNWEFWSFFVIIFKLRNLAIRCLVSFFVGFLKISQTSNQKRNNVYFKAIVHYVCFLWNSLEQDRENDCAAGGFVVCVSVCVCVSALCGCEWRELNGSSFKTHSLVSWNISGFLQFVTLRLLTNLNKKKVKSRYRSITVEISVGFII
jgi:hypothetical protein